VFDKYKENPDLSDACLCYLSYICHGFWDCFSPFKSRLLILLLRSSGELIKQNFDCIQLIEITKYIETFGYKFHINFDIEYQDHYDNSDDGIVNMLKKHNKRIYNENDFNFKSDFQVIHYK